MASEAPPFWWEAADWRAAALWPFSALYGLAASYRMRAAKREETGVPVLCIGNFTVGGEGKTPVAIALGREAREQGLKPGFLSRGHGGSFSGPHLVDPHHDSARLVGDEPLLLAEHAATVVTPDRAAGARRLVEEGCDFILMDDGFQSARIRIDHALIVVDASRGLGNGHVIPGGPLRAPLLEQLRHADAILRMGAGEDADEVVRMASRAGKPVFEAHVEPRSGHDLRGKELLAFAGIGNPGKFFETLRQAGGKIAVERPFPDHHVFTEEELRELSSVAEGKGYSLVTTAKDAVRLRHGSKSMRRFAESIHVLEIDVVFENPATPVTLIRRTVEAWKERRLKV